MFGAFTSFGKLGSLARAIAAAWSPLSLWPDGISSAGMWISARTLTSEWQDYTGTTPVSIPGTVADTSNPVGLALDIRAGATVLTDPGNHMLQSTSSARPLMSARVNLLQYTEDFTNGYWLNATATVTPNYGTAPDGTQTSTRLQFAGAGLAILKASILSSNTPSTASCWIKGPVGETLQFEASLATANLVTLTGAWQRATCPHALGQSFVIGTYGGATARDVEVWHPQLQYGLDATDYQPILTDGSSYSATGITPFQKYDGTDDGMATASFAAGTLINGMDCMIAVRRDSANHVILGPYNSVGDLGHYIGNAESGYDSACCTGVGSPTVWVDGAQLTHGWASELDTAVTLGYWHIIEFRGLDMSAWTALGFSRFEYTGYNLNGARGDILLYPSTASTTDKDAARQYLADKYGVTLA